MVCLSLFAAALASASAVSAASGKRGLAWPSDNDFNPGIFSSSQVTWLYNWGVNPPSQLHNLFPFIPMQWNTAGIANLPSEITADNANTVLGFNEPDNAGQANISPSVAASYWKQYIQPLKAKGIKLVSPAYTNSGPPNGITWFDQFIGNCTGCTFDAIACHWYGGWTTDLTEFINDSKKYNTPLWLTEFGLSWGNPAAGLSNYEEFLPLALQYLDNEPAVQRYAFFGAFYSNSPYDMITSSGTLSALGQIYVAN